MCSRFSMSCMRTLYPSTGTTKFTTTHTRILQIVHRGWLSGRVPSFSPMKGCICGGDINIRAKSSINGIFPPVDCAYPHTRQSHILALIEISNSVFLCNTISWLSASCTVLSPSIHQRTFRITIDTIKNYKRPLRYQMYQFNINGAVLLSSPHIHNHPTERQFGPPIDVGTWTINVRWCTFLLFLFLTNIQYFKLSTIGFSCLLIHQLRIRRIVGVYERLNIRIGVLPDHHGGIGRTFVMAAMVGCLVWTRSDRLYRTVM